MATLEASFLAQQPFLELMRLELDALVVCFGCLADPRIFLVRLPVLRLHDE